MPAYRKIALYPRWSTPIRQFATILSIRKSSIYLLIRRKTSCPQPQGCYFTMLYRFIVLFVFNALLSIRKFHLLVVGSNFAPAVRNIVLCHHIMSLGRCVWNNYQI